PNGTMCSRRQQLAFRPPTGSAARRPSPSETSTAHQLHGPELMVRAKATRAVGRDGRAGLWPAPLSSDAMAEGLKITVLEGDETGQELLEQSLRVLAPEVVGLPVELDRHDLSLARRR